MTAGPPQPARQAGSTSTPTLRRSLKGRHIQFIALGGAIGSGLFYGSADTIGLAGPAVVIGYLVGGGIMFIIMRALGEMAAAEPVAGSFAAYAHRYLGPFAGFTAGWTYWFSWIVVNMAELSAFGVYVQYWFPGIPRWLSALVALMVIVAINLTSARSFGEAEFWFALIKVTAILALIAFGTAILLFHLGHGAAVGNLWDYGGVLPHGLTGLLVALPLIMFSFGGTELVGITAGEATDPQKTIPAAINQVILRILIFYVGAIVFIMMLVPWTRVGLGASPFVIAFRDIGIPDAPSVLNFVVITAALSAFNSGLFSTGRMLLTLSQSHQAPGWFDAISRRGRVPSRGIVFSGGVLLIGVLIDLVIPQQAFLYLSSIATLALIVIWSMILITQWRFRRARQADGTLDHVRFRLRGWPYTTVLGLTGMGLVVVMMGFQASTRTALYVAPLWFAVLSIGYGFTRRKRADPPS